MSIWEITVSNIGVVYRSENGAEAFREFGEWKRLSESDFGRASGESVSLLRDGEIYFDHAGVSDHVE